MSSVRVAAGYARGERHMSDARRTFALNLLVGLIDLVRADQTDYAAVVAGAIAQQVADLELEVRAEARAEGFEEGVRAAQAAMQPDAGLERLRRAGEEAVAEMLDAYVQIRNVTSH